MIGNIDECIEANKRKKIFWRNIILYYLAVFLSVVFVLFQLRGVDSIIISLVITVGIFGAVFPFYYYFKMDYVLENLEHIKRLNVKNFMCFEDIIVSKINDLCYW